MSVCRIEQETFKHLCEVDAANEEFEREWEWAVGRVDGYRSLDSALDALDAFQDKFGDGFCEGDEEKLEEINYKIFEKKCTIDEGLAEFRKHFENRF